MAKGSSKGMLSGLTDKSPPAVDSSQKLGKESVNSGATRSETAPAQATIGPRTA
jgi:hypothetical protein